MVTYALIGVVAFLVFLCFPDFDWALAGGAADEFSDNIAKARRDRLSFPAGVARTEAITPELGVYHVGNQDCTAAFMQCFWC